jgi:hypothetical protein
MPRKHLFSRSGIASALVGLSAAIAVFADGSGSGSCSYGMRYCCSSITIAGSAYDVCICCASPQYNCQAVIINPSGGGMEVRAECIQ